MMKVALPALGQQIAYVWQGTGTGRGGGAVKLGMATSLLAVLGAKVTKVTRKRSFHERLFIFLQMASGAVLAGSIDG
jgi:hypothetical protein